MIFLKEFNFTSPATEDLFFKDQRRTCYDTFYPYAFFPRKEFSHIDFDDITILYGGNGSGKTTALNVIADTIGATRQAPYNRSNFFESYVSHCRADFINEEFTEKRIMTSDDIFDYMLDIRQLNERIDSKREDRFDEYMDYKYSSFKFESMDQYEELKRRNMAKSKSQSYYIRQTLIDNVREYSNGESAFRYFTQKIDENSIYILDEPENSLSPQLQMELVNFIVDSAKYYRCQFIIATHSPFMLSMEGAKIYDMDAYPVQTKKWTELDNVRAYYNLFKSRAEEFE